MKAYILHDINNISLEETDKPTLKPGEVLVEVKAAGICGSDIPRIYTNGAHVLPLIIGHEFAGKVVEAADSDGENWVGKKVGIFPLIPCKECDPCEKKQYEMCRHYNYLGSRCNGGYAEYVAVPVWNLIELNDDVPYEIAAMMEPMAVATHAVRGILAEGEDKNANILVYSLGTIGIMVCMILKQLGYKNIFAIGNKEAQINAVADNLGVSRNNLCNTKTQDIATWLNIHHYSFDICLECVGKPETMNACIDMVNPAGKIMLVGNPYSDMDIPRDTYWKILRNQLTVKGTWNSSFTHDENDDWNFLAKLLNSGELRPEYLITHRYNLENLMEGFELMRDKSEPYIKCMWVKD